MDSFIWDDVFLTDLIDVDRQHKRLVDLINALGDRLASESAASDDIEAVIEELLSYAHYHFSEEEQLMEQGGIDPRHRKQHVNEHRDFLDQVLELHSGGSQEHNAPATLLQFLIHWLAYHILGSDQNMARQLHAIEQGATPEEAFEAQEQSVNKATEPLLHALKGLFELVSARNRDLQLANQSLELRVAERTRELTEANAHLNQVAHTDALTQLHNRRSALEQLEALWTAGLETKANLSCIMIDADHFKEVNDRHGHDAGDLVLQVLATQLSQASRNRDIVCRLGGDEFLIICAESDLTDTIAQAEFLLAGVNSIFVKTGDGAWRGSASMGVASRTHTMHDMHDLIKMADNSVYEAKRAGKNCVRALQVALAPSSQSA